MSRRGYGHVVAAAVALSAALLLVGCGESFVAGTGGAGGGSWGGGGSGGAGEQASRGERFAETACERTFTCCPPADLVELFSPDGAANYTVNDHAGCRIFYRTTWDAVIEPFIEQSVKAGRLEIDEAAFDGCLASFKELSCAEFSEAPTVCEAMFIPKVELDGACTSELECTSGKCDVPLGAAEGTCVMKPPPVKESGTCKESADCEPELFCHLGLCAARRTEGESCSNDDQCRSKQCVGEEKLAGKCEKICEGGGPGPGPIDALIEPLGGPVVQAECARLFECCEGGERAELLGVDPGSTTTCLQTLGLITAYSLVSVHNSVIEGKLVLDAEKLGACLAAYETGSCEEVSKSPLFTCDEATAGQLEDGETCATSAECKSHHCKEADGNGKCVTPPELGASCSGLCADGAYCAAGKCVEQKSPGAVCIEDVECAEGTRCYGSAGKTCKVICDGL